MQRRWGYLAVLGAVVLWGSSGPMSVALFQMGAEPESLALLRPLLGVGALLLFDLFRKKRTGLKNVRELLLLVGLGGLTVGLFQLAFQFSTETVGVPTTVGLLYLSPAIVVATSGPVLGEWPRPLTVLLALVSVAGVWLMVMGAGTATGGGSVLWGVLCGVGFAAYTLFGRRFAGDHGAFDVILYSTVGGTLILLTAWGVGATDVRMPPLRSWPLLITFAVTTMAVAAVLYFEGLRRIEASRATIFATAEPVVASLLAAALLGQTMAGIGWVGLALVVSGVAGAYSLRGEAIDPH